MSAVDEHDPAEEAVAEAIDLGSASWRERAIERSLREARAKAETRSERYIHTAVEILSETGHADFTVQELVERSHTSLRSFYQHFGGKDDLLLALIEDVLASAISGWRAQLPELAPLDALRMVVDTVHGHTMSPRGAALNRALNRYNLHLADARPAEFRTVLVPLYDLLREVIAAGAGAGQVRADLDPDMLTAAFLEALIGASLLNALHGVPVDQPLGTETMWAFLQAGLVGGR